MVVVNMQNNPTSLCYSVTCLCQQTAQKNQCTKKNNATSSNELYTQLQTCYDIDRAETLRNHRDCTIDSQLALIGGWGFLIMCWRSHFCCQMLFCLVENHDKAASWQGDRLTVLTPSARCLIDSGVCTCACVCTRLRVCLLSWISVCVCVSVCGRARACFARWRGVHAALIRPLIPGCSNTVGVKSDTLSWGWDEMLTLFLCARVIRSYVYPFRGMFTFSKF